TTPTLTGTAEAGATVEILLGGTVVGSVVADGDGAWSWTSAALAEGVHTFTARSIDAAGNVSPVSTGLTIGVDITGPEVTIDAVGGDDLLEQSEGGAPLVISGTTNAADGAEVTVVLNGHAYTALAAGGVWSVSVPAERLAAILADDRDDGYALSATVADAAGNVAAAWRTLEVDTPPTAADDRFQILETTVLTGDVFADNGDGADFDPDGPALTVAGGNG